MTILQRLSFVILLSLAGSALGTDLYFDDLSATSPNGKFRFDARSPENAPGKQQPFARGFVMTLTAVDRNAVLWQRQQQSDEQSPARAFVNNDGRLVVCCGIDQLLVFDLAGKRTLRLSVLRDVAGAKVIRLPSYSPDLNPIEMAISKIKSLLRKAARRSMEDLIDSLGDAVRSITPDDARGFIGHCGYNATIE